MSVIAVKDGPPIRWAIDNLIRVCKPDLLFLSTEKSDLAALAELRVRVVRFRRTGNVSSTRIRDSIASGKGSWMRLTGRSVTKWILEHDGVGRICRAYQAAAAPAEGPRAVGPSRDSSGHRARTLRRGSR